MSELTPVHGLKNMHISFSNRIRLLEYPPLHGDHRALGFRDVQEGEKVLDLGIFRDLHLHAFGMPVSGETFA